MRSGMESIRKLAVPRGRYGHWRQLLRYERQLKGLRVWQTEGMKRPFAASVWREGNWYVAQCLELDVATKVIRKPRR